MSIDEGELKLIGKSIVSADRLPLGAGRLNVSQLAFFCQ